jgi:hypothetical protein
MSRRVESVFGLGLRPLQEALNQKADEVQREFIALGERIDEIGKLLLELRGEERTQQRSKQQELRTQQQEIADEVNLWRERARAVMHQGGREGLRAFLNELLEVSDESLQEAITRTLEIIDLPEEELSKFQTEPELKQLTAVGRLIERARLEYDMRRGDVAIRQREAVEFANRPGMAQDDDVLRELEPLMDDNDPIVHELAILTMIQLQRFRAMRVANLDIAHDSVQYLTRIDHAAVIPVLIEVLENPRSGYMEEEGETVERDNSRSRMVALLRLVEWHTAEAQLAIQGRKFDKDPHIIRAAERALDLFPGAWAGPLKGTGSLKDKM